MRGSRTSARYAALDVKTTVLDPGSARAPYRREVFGSFRKRKRLSSCVHNVCAWLGSGTQRLRMLNSFSCCADKVWASLQGCQHFFLLRTQLDGTLQPYLSYSTFFLLCDCRQSRVCSITANHASFRAERQASKCVRAGVARTAEAGPDSWYELLSRRNLPWRKGISHPTLALRKLPCHRRDSCVDNCRRDARP